MKVEVKTAVKKVAAKRTTKKTAKKSKKVTRSAGRPVDNKFKLTQKFGVKDSRYIIGYHTGDDFACPEGTPVHAPFDGSVVEVSNSPDDYGLYMKVLGKNGKRMWLFAHLSRAYAQPGHHVTKNQVIAFSGNTGDTTGPHLHAEERKSPFGYRDCVKPTAWEEI